ncbi:hypothetical protein H4582DRAFT_1986869, partial [Lactarius indigo]
MVAVLLVVVSCCYPLPACLLSSLYIPVDYVITGPALHNGIRTPDGYIVGSYTLANGLSLFHQLLYYM